MNLTTLHFPFQLHPGLIPNFRAALVEQIGLGHYLFHGHDNSEPGVTKHSNDYPLIRFAIRKGQPEVIGMGPGADAIIRHLIPAIPDTLIIAEQPYDTVGWRLKTGSFTGEILKERQNFGLYQWIALNKQNFTDWKSLEGKESARNLLLSKCLTGHLRALAEILGYSQEDRQRISGTIVRQDRVKKIKWHRTQLIGFDVVAEANFLPAYGLGLGRCHSFGFGEVCSERGYAALTAFKRKPKQKGDEDDDAMMAIAE